MSEWTGEAKTADAAVALGLKKLGLSETQVDVKVLTEHTSGLMSLFGFRRVKVRIVEKARRFDRRERPDQADEFDRSSHSLDYRRGGPKHRRDDRAKDNKATGSQDRDPRGRAGDGRIVPAPEERRRGDKGPSSPPASEKKPEKIRGPKFQRALSGEARPGTKRSRSDKGPLAPSEGPALSKRVPPTTGSAFHPAVPPDTLLAQWKALLGWDDLAWEMKPTENHRIAALIKTAHGERLAGNGGRVLEAFEYIFNLVSSGGDREKPWVSFRVAGFPSVEESRIVDKALFAAFQVRRTAKVFHLDPMSPGQRRIVHQTLVHHPDVETASEGEGSARHVVVKPKDKK